MQKELTKKETLKSSSDVTYFKLYFGQQWFIVAPWQYKPANLMNIFKLVSDSVEGETYDIKWRQAKINNRPTTLLTGFERVENVFVWDGEEQGGDDTSNSFSQPHTDVLGGEDKHSYQEQSKTSQGASESFNPFEDLGFEFDENNIPF